MWVKSPYLQPLQNPTMIPKSLLYKLVRISDRKIIDEGSKIAMKKRAKGNPNLTVVMGSPRSQIEQTLGEKSIVIKQPLSTLNNNQIEGLKALFSVTPEQFDKANKKERKKYEHFSDGKRVDAPPKDGFYRNYSEGRITGVMPKKKIPKLKLEVWDQQSLSNFFRNNQIHADHTDGWFVTFNIPARKMTVEDQLELMLALSDTEYEIQINRQHKHLIIDTLKGNQS